jgi:hypothetical protein
MPFLRLGALPSSVAIAATLIAGSMLVQLPSAQAAAPADPYSREMTRLINGARAAAGKPALKVDVFLASKARDGSIPCPDDAAKSISGRSLDFATYGQMSHQLRLCDASAYTLSSKTFVSMMQTAWGYGSVGEILLVNGGYGGDEFLYTYKGWSTWTYATTGHGMMGWATSSSNWNIIMGSYDRVGCGAWSPSGSTVYYACLFSVGGPSPSGLAAAPIASPFHDPLPTPPATPIPTPAPVATPAPVKTPAHVNPTQPPTSGSTRAPANPGPVGTSQGYSGGQSTGPGPSSTPAPVPTGTQTPPAGPSNAAASASDPPLGLVAAPQAQPSALPAGAAANMEPPASPGPNSRSISMLMAEAGLATWVGLLGLLIISRRRRRRGTRMTATA